MSMIALFASGHLDRNKGVLMCIIHDFAKPVVGDLTPADNIPKLKTHRREAKTIDFIHKPFAAADDKQSGNDLVSVWQGMTGYVHGRRDYKLPTSKIWMIWSYFCKCQSMSIDGTAKSVSGNFLCGGQIVSSGVATFGWNILSERRG